MPDWDTFEVHNNLTDAERTAQALSLLSNLLADAKAMGGTAAIVAIMNPDGEAKIGICGCAELVSGLVRGIAESVTDVGLALRENPGAAH